MKRSFFLVPALVLAVFGGLLALDIINFESGLAAETSRTDRWVMIFSFAGVAAFLGLASAEASADAADEPTSGRAAAARKLGEGRPDPADLPAKPGSLLKKNAEARAASSETETSDVPTNFDDTELDEADVIKVDVDAIDAIDFEVLPTETEATEAPTTEADAELADTEPTNADPVVGDDNAALVAIPEPDIDLVDAELQSLIDEDQMQEINDLVAAADDETPEDDTTDLVAGADSAEPLARLELRLADYDDEDLKRVVKESEAVVIAEMVRTGQLTSEGELTEKDIASMIFLAYTSDEMLTELQLRRADQHGQAGLDASTGSDFAPLKNIE